MREPIRLNGGLKYDKGKRRMDLYPVEALEGTVDVLTFGATKYGDRNWEKGILYGRVYAAAQRHLTAWWKGEDTDEETGLSHLDHAACCIAFLQTFVKRGMGTCLDDRPTSGQGEINDKDSQDSAPRNAIGVR